MSKANKYIEAEYGIYKAQMIGSVADYSGETKYIYEEPYSSVVKEMLDKLSLPMPDNTKVFRGTCHDIIFIDSHGVVIKIGPTSVYDLLSPGALQPIGWLQNNEYKLKSSWLDKEDNIFPLSVVIYPGIERIEDKYEHEIDTFILRLVDVFTRSEHGNNDISPRNIGVVSSYDKNSKEDDVALMLDVDNYRNGPTHDIVGKKRSIIKSLSEKFNNAADVMGLTLQEAFGDIKDMDCRAFYGVDGIGPENGAFYSHQPLRQMFFDAFEDIDSPDKSKLHEFWNRCAAVTNNPERDVKVPVWTIDNNGLYVRDEVIIPELVLKTPWTGNSKDKVMSFERYHLFSGSM